MFDIISIGDSVIDAFMIINEAEVLCDLDSRNCRLCLSFADKIPVDKFKLSTAGNALNNAIGSAKLGLKTAIYTEIGNDNFGKMVVDALNQDRVSTDYVNLNKDQATNLHTVISYKVERTILVYHAPRAYRLPDLESPPRWFYYTSLSKGFEEFQKSLVDYVKKNPSIKLAFNPATFHLKAGLEALKEVFAVAEVVFVNREEAKKLLGINLEDGTPIKDLLTNLHKLGTRKIVVTDGPKGSAVFDGEKFHQLGLYDVPIVERTGVGDAFATGFVAALAYEKDIEEALKWGTINSAGVIQQIGPQAGLQTKEQVEEILSSNPSFTSVNLL